jgi:hypothetical protein
LGDMDEPSAADLSIFSDRHHIRINLQPSNFAISTQSSPNYIDSPCFTEADVINMKSEGTDIGWMRLLGKDGKRKWQKVKRELHEDMAKHLLLRMDADFAFHTLYIEEKKKWLELRMESMKVPIVQGVFKIKVRRTHIVEDTLQQFKQLMPDLQNELKVEF